VVNQVVAALVDLAARAEGLLPTENPSRGAKIT
jgi:hypothetical protein